MKMNIRLVAFYKADIKTPIKRLIGTLHVELVDLGIQIRGILVRRQKQKWRFEVPSKHGMFRGERVRYPIVDFSDKNVKKQLYAELLKQAPAYVEARLKPVVREYKEVKRSV